MVLKTTEALSPRVAHNARNVTCGVDKTFLASKADGFEPKLRTLGDRDAFRRLSEIARSTVSACIEIKESSSTAQTCPNGKILSAQDIVESPRIHFRQKPDREDPKVEEKACIDVDLAIRELKNELDSIHSEARLAKSDEEIQKLNERKNAHLLSLSTLAAKIATEIQEKEDFEFYSLSSKALQLERKVIYSQIRNVEKNEYDKAKLANLNQEAIRVNRLLIKVQLKVAQMLLTNAARPKDGGARIAAYGALNGALTSAQLLKEELHFRYLRLRGAERIRDIESTNWEGQNVWVTNLGNFSVMFETPNGDQEPTVKINQRHWINAHATLETIRLAVQRGEIEDAKRRLGMLQSLYTKRDLGVLELYGDISKDLRAIERTIGKLPEGVKPEEAVCEDIKTKTRALALRISSPKHWIWMEVEYKTLGHAVRGQLKTIAGYKHDYALVLQNKALIDYYAEKLQVAARQGYLSKRNQELITEGIQNLAIWTNRGFVYPKQFSKSELKSTLECITRGVKYEERKDTEHLAKSEYASAAGNLAKASQNLGEVEDKGGRNTRLREIKRIVDSKKDLAHTLYVQFRDRDIKARADEIQNALKPGDYKSALTQIDEIRSRYFGHLLVEPGYIRAAALLNEVENLIQRANRSKSQDQFLKTVELKLSRLKEDILHKEYYRVLVFNIESRTCKFYFVPPGTSFKGLLGIIGKDPNTAFVSIGKGRIPNKQLPGIRLNDETPTVSIATKPPQKGYKPPYKKAV